MSKSFKDLNKPQKQFRMVEKTGKVFRREFNADNTYLDIDIEQDAAFWEFVNGFEDIPH